MLTLILPVRDWPAERIEACLRSFVALGSPLLNEIIVIDFGSAEPIALPANVNPMVRLVRLEAKVWSLAEAINAGVLLASNDLVAKTDADILISPDSADAFGKMVEGLKAGDFGLGVCQATDLHQSLSVADASDAIARGEHPLGRLRAKWGQGGLVFFSKKTWQDIGGFDSRFTGWGNEDNDFAERVRRGGGKIQWADRNRLHIFHVWHPPSHAATGVLSQRQQNQKIASTDKSILRSTAFRHSNFAQIAAPAVIATAPLVTLAVATTARPFRDRMIREAIDSFRGQIDEDFEIVVVDNGSPPEEVDALRATLGKLRWPQRLHLEVTERPSIPGARNIITSLAKGKYICVVDDDDIALPNRLADHLRVFEGDGMLHGSHGGWIDFDEHTGIIERNGGKHRTAATLLRGTGKITAHPASLYRTDVMRAVPYDESFALGSDLDLALRMAVLGFEIGHTNSYLMLRRYHSANVTITGQANQVSNGATARLRALGTYSWNRQGALEQAAKEHDKDVYCRNQMSFDTLAEKIPDYAGQWQIHVPISALSGPSASRMLQLEGAANDTTVPAARFNQELLEQLFDIVPGELATRQAGLNQPIYFCSVPLQGLKRAKRVRKAVEALIGMPALMTSVRQAEIDRNIAFNWKNIETKSGERVLQSDEHEDLSTLLVALAQFDGRSLMSQSLSILSDFGERGRVYSLLTPSIKGYEELQRFRFDLEQRTGLRFHQVAGNGQRSELTLTARAH